MKHEIRQKFAQILGSAAGEKGKGGFSPLKDREDSSTSPWRIAKEQAAQDTPATGTTDPAPTDATGSDSGG